MSSSTAGNYRAVLSFDPERKVFIARAPELDHCAGEGGTRAEAIARLEEEIQAQVSNMLAGGIHAPVPVDEEAFSGEVQVKLSSQLHRDLAWQARVEGVEIAALAAEVLAAGIEQRKTLRQRSGNRQAPVDAPAHDNIGNSINPRPSGYNRGGGRYNPMMEDRANFIEYVRNLEHGSHGNHHGAPGGGRRRNRNRGHGGGGPGGNPGNGGPPKL